MQAPFHVVFTLIRQIVLDLCRAFIKNVGKTSAPQVFLKFVFRPLSLRSAYLLQDKEQAAAIVFFGFGAAVSKRRELQCQIC